MSEEKKEVCKDIIIKYFGEIVDESKGTIGYCIYPNTNITLFVKDLYKIDRQLKEKEEECAELETENERLRNLLGKPYKRRLDLENEQLQSDKIKLIEALENIYQLDANEYKECNWGLVPMVSEIRRVAKQALQEVRGE